MIWILIAIISLLVFKIKGKLSFLIFIFFTTIIAGIFNGGEAVYSFTPQQAFFSKYASGYGGVKLFLMGVLIFILPMQKLEFTYKEAITIFALLIFPVFVSISSLFGSIGLSGGFLPSFVSIFEVVFVFVFIKYIIKNGCKDKLIDDLALFFSVFIIFLFLGLMLEPELSLRAGRFRGVSGSSNWMATYLCFINLLLFSFYLNRSNRHLTIISLILGVILLILTGSRSSIFAFFAALLLICFRTGVNKSMISIVVFILIGSLISIVVGFDLSSFDIARVSSLENTRESVWLRGYTSLVNSGDYLMGVTNASAAVESVYLSVLFVYGIMGLIFFVPMFLLLFYFSSFIKPLGQGSLILGSGLIMAFLLISIFENIYFGKIASFNSFLYLGVGLLVVGKYKV